MNILPSRSARWRSICVFCLCILMLALSACTEINERLTTLNLVGREAPDFTLPALEGDDITLSDMKGSVVAVNFWATWCPPCVAEMPALQSAVENHSAGDFVVLAITNESVGTAEGFINENDLSLTVLFDHKGFIDLHYGVMNIPTTIWIDADGVVRTIHYGMMSESQIEDYIEEYSEPL